MKRKIFALILSVVTLLSVGLTAFATPAETKSFIENADGTFFYPFNKNGDWTAEKGKFWLMGRGYTVNGTKVATFKQSDGINNSGMISVLAGGNYPANDTSYGSITMQENGTYVVTGKVRYANAEKLLAKHCYLSFVLAGFNNVPVYTDEACTTLKENVSSGYVQVLQTVDIDDVSLSDGNWHTFRAELPAKGLPYRGNANNGYVDLTGKTVNLWFRPYANAVPTGNSVNVFPQSFIDEFEGQTIGVSGTNYVGPYAEVLLDDFESYFETTSAVATEDSYNKTYTYETQDSADVTGYRNVNSMHTYMGSYNGKDGVMSNWSYYPNTSGKTLTFKNNKVREGEILRVSGDIAMVTPVNYNLPNINVYAMLILNGGASNNPKGFYQDAECTIPFETVSGNAICHSATMQDGLTEGWLNFTHDFDTTTVYKSSIKTASADTNKTTAYVKPWEVENVEVWVRVNSTSVNATAFTLNKDTTEFSASYLTSLGFVLNDGATEWADSDGVLGNTDSNRPKFDYVIDNIGINSVNLNAVDAGNVEVTNATVTGGKTEGATATVDYTITDGYTEGNSRVYIKENGAVVAVANATGSFTYTFPKNSVGKTYTYEIVPAVNGVYSTNTYTGVLGTVVEKFTAEKVTNGVTWSYDASLDTENTVVLVALYNIDGEMIALDSVDITAGQTYTDSLTDKDATLAKVFHWVDTENATPIVKNFEFKLN